MNRRLWGISGFFEFTVGWRVYHGFRKVAYPFNRVAFFFELRATEVRMKALIARRQAKGADHAE